MCKDRTNCHGAHLCLNLSSMIFWYDLYCLGAAGLAQNACKLSTAVMNSAGDAAFGRLVCCEVYETHGHGVKQAVRNKHVCGSMAIEARQQPRKMPNHCIQASGALSPQAFGNSCSPQTICLIPFGTNILVPFAFTLQQPATCGFAFRW